jgi:hypothetical protein
VKRINYINNINLKKHQTMDSQKYLKQYAALEEAALLCANIGNNPIDCPVGLFDKSSIISDFALLKT